MNLSRSQIFRLSRDTRFLFRACAAIAVGSIVIAFVISLLTRERDSLAPFPPDTEESSPLPPDHPPLPGYSAPAESDPVEHWATRIRTAAELADQPAPPLERDVSPDTLHGLELSEPDEEPGAGVETGDLASFESEIPEDEALDAGERERLLALARGLLAEDDAIRGKAIAVLREAGAETPPPPHTWEFLGDILSHARDWDGAIDAYRAEFERSPEDSMRALVRLVDLLGREGRIDEIGDLPGLPEWVEDYSSFDRKRQAAKDRDFGKLFLLVLEYEFRIPIPSLVILSLFSASIWYLIVTRFAGNWRQRWKLHLPAFVLGIFSAVFTLYAVWLQEEILRFTHDPTGSIIDQVLYCIAGIGLREETIKLLLFVPLVPVLARRHDDIDALVCAGLVGLGFAFQENISYLHQSGEFATWSRFLTANFLHISLTGVAGLSLVRCWRRPRRHWDQFLYDFLIVVAAHGIYDALLMVPQFGEYAVLGIVVFAGIAYLFLDQALRLMVPNAQMALSPLAVFVLGAAVLMGVVLCYACWGMPFGIALRQYAAGVAGMVPVAFIFINRLRAL